MGSRIEHAAVSTTAPHGSHSSTAPERAAQLAGVRGGGSAEEPANRRLSREYSGAVQLNESNGVRRWHEMRSGEVRGGELAGGAGQERGWVKRSSG